jgi:DNA replication protein DnaC
LRERLQFLCRPQLLSSTKSATCRSFPAAATCLFQLANARYERGAMILISNRGFAEWRDVFGHPVVATALLDRLLHHATVIHIEGASYRCASTST